MDYTHTLTAWQRIGLYEVEYACDYYYNESCVMVGHGDTYYTGRVRNPQ